MKLHRPLERLETFLPHHSANTSDVPANWRLPPSFHPGRFSFFLIPGLVLGESRTLPRPWFAVFLPRRSGPSVYWRDESVANPAPNLSPGDPSQTPIVGGDSFLPTNSELFRWWSKMSRRPRRKCRSCDKARRALPKKD